MKRLLVMLSFLSILIFACGLGDENVESNSQVGGNDLLENQDENQTENQEDVNPDEDKKEGINSVVVNDFLFDVEADVEEDKITFKLKLTNKSDEVHEVTFSSGQQFNLYVKDEQGNMLYNFAEGKMFTQALITERLGPDKSFYVEDIWESEKIRDLSKITIETELLIFSINNEQLQTNPFSQKFTISIPQ